MTPLTADTADYTVPASVSVLADDNSAILSVTIKTNTGDIDLECFEIAMTSTSLPSLDVYQTTTTICIKDDETTSE